MLLLAGCGAFSSAAPAEEHFTVAQWNVHNLFDGVEDGTEYRQFREAAGWTAEKYQARLTSLSLAIEQMMPQGMPDLIGFTEVENANVLNDLAGGRLSRHGYYWTAFTKLPGSAIGLGFISRYPMTDVRAHSITVKGETAPRPILEVRLEPGGKPLIFLLGHWKSKLGGADATEHLRRYSARVVQRRLNEIKKSEPQTPVIVMGDLNLNHDDFYRRRMNEGGALIRYALMPDSPDAAALASHTIDRQDGPLTVQDFLVITSARPPVSRYFPAETHVLYSPWIEDKDGGSYFFRGGWETIDHFLLSAALFSELSWNYAGAAVLNREPFITKDGIPNAYIPRLGRGLSDHLPLLLFLKF